ESYLRPHSFFDSSPCHNIGGRDRERRALAGHQRHTECSVTNECNAATRPMLHLDLADTIEIQAFGPIQFIQYARTFPSSVPEPVPQYRFLRCYVEYWN